MSTPVFTLGDLTTAQTRAGFARFAPNWLPVRVISYHAPEVIDGTAFPASVTIRSLLEYVRVVPSPEDGAPPLRLNPGERKLTGEDMQAWTGSADTSARWTAIARPYDDVRVPFLSAGTSELAIISDPRVGDIGILQLAGRSIADALAKKDGEPVLPEFMPNPLRLSDGMYAGTLIAGDAGLPPEAQPAAGTSQIGPRDSRATSVYLRLTSDAWTLAGTSIKLGADASAGVGRVGDPVAPGAGWTSWLTAELAAISAVTFPPRAPVAQPDFAGTITGGSGTVTCMD